MAVDADLEEHRRRYTEQIQPALDEPVLAIGAFTLAGTRGNTVIRKLSRFRPGRRGRSARRDPDLPVSFLLAITGSAVHAFSYERAGNGDVIAGHRIRSWSRDGTRVELVPGIEADQVTLTLSGGTIVAMESADADFNGSAIRTLVSGP